MENLKYPFHWKMNTLTHFKDGYRQHFQFQSSGNEWAGVWPGSGWDASVSLCTPALTPIPASCYCNSGEAAETESCYPRGRHASGIPASPLRIWTLTSRSGSILIFKWTHFKKCWWGTGHHGYIPTGSSREMSTLQPKWALWHVGRHGCCPPG